MKEEHIRFEDWEPGEALDQEHLRSCKKCREDFERVRFLREVIASAPEVEVPPFFSNRVARLAVSQARGFWELLDRMARRMAPIFAALVLVAAFLLYHQDEERSWTQDVPMAWLSETEGEQVPETLDEMVLVLAQTEWEEGSVDAKQY